MKYTGHDQLALCSTFFICSTQALSSFYMKHDMLPVSVYAKLNYGSYIEVKNIYVL